MKTKEAIEQKLQELDRENEFFLGSILARFIEFYDQNLETKIRNDPTFKDFKEHPQDEAEKKVVELCEWVLD